MVKIIRGIMNQTLRHAYLKDRQRSVRNSGKPRRSSGNPPYCMRHPVIDQGAAWVHIRIFVPFRRGGTIAEGQR
ncbi:MAG: hypothetical protein C6P37_13280 [Caldibacillus debilis]|nr:hypothetical protein [Caldibacillus debilis]MBO2483342.1 hypothetical protein [Bacillaceae bacterium]MBY6273664.1 hypothetical protein [Bacillaceae bacterium]OUM83591.1 MAG: hypothetical protein BAA03_00245 [Caldibacillus debilis]REJ24329.1 MAG: hypothetical protein C6W56_14680 [Caldibacillus debilis]REJ26677.1 MAG: hypothetical protein C6P37_13280 [Caldibacillus debilis]